MERGFEDSDAAAIRSDREAVGGDLSRAMVEASARTRITIDPRVVESARRAEVMQIQFKRAPKPHSTLKKLGDGMLKLFGYIGRDA